MDIGTAAIWLSEHLGDLRTGALFGLLTGLIFGFAAERSAFCLRSAAIEFGRGRLGPALAIWLLTFSTAGVWVQSAHLTGLFQPQAARMMAVTGSLSGAIIGGLVFGVGMVMARGCSGRLLVLAGTGNMRSIVAGLVFACTAQMTLNGALAPLRQQLAGLWVTGGGRNTDLLAAVHLPAEAGLAIGLAIAALALWLSWRNGLTPTRLVFACGAGFAVAVGWVLTFSLSQASFEPVSVTSATFSGPSANTLMALLQQGAAVNFDIGLIPGVFIGAFVAAVVGGRLHWQSYSTPGQMARSMTGGALMGFGGMLAGGCAIGNGLTGTSIFALTAWLATVCFFIGAAIADRLFDRPAAEAQAPVAPAV